MIEKAGAMLKCLKDFWNLEGYYIRRRACAKYYIIIRSEGGAGFFSNYMWVLGHVVLARSLGYIPVVDMKNYSTLYSEETAVDGVDNAWNYYFQDIDKVTLEEAYASGKYVLGRDKYLAKYAEKFCMPVYRFPTAKTICYYAPVIEQNMRLREDLKAAYNAEWQKKVGEAEHVLGIHIRGTDMKNNLGHPMPAAVKDYLAQTYRILEQNPEITKVFLATDENNVKELYEKEFRDSRWTLFMNEAFRVWDHGEKRKTGVHETKVENPRQHHKYLMGREVLQDAWFLYKCEYLICGYSNITNVAILWNQNRYKQIVCIQSDGKGIVVKDGEKYNI